jgi:hypothetical protein
LFSAVVLDPPVGSLNPSAVEAALRLEADVVFFPTFFGRCLERLRSKGFWEEETRIMTRGNPCRLIVGRGMG